MINGADVLAIDASKARQLSLIAGLGLAIPATRVVHRAADLAAARERTALSAGGQGEHRRLGRRDRPLRRCARSSPRRSRDGMMPDSVDSVLLVQEYVPARGGTITRIETLGGSFLYAIEVDGGGSFDLCPADACLRRARPPAITMTRGRARRRR